MDKKFAIVMSAFNRTSFDFAGMLVEETSNTVRLENPLVIEYSESNSVIRLAPLHLPYGMIDIIGSTTEVALPKEGVAYVVTLQPSETNAMYKMYTDFFNRQIQ